MYYARYRTTRVHPSDSRRIVLDERWVGIDAAKENIARERAEQIRLPKDRYVAEDAETTIDLFTERDMIDIRVDRAFLVENLEDRSPNPREAAMAETLNALRECLDDLDRRLLVRDPDGREVEVLRIEDLARALDFGQNSDMYLTTTPADFRRERDAIVNELFAGIKEANDAAKRRPKEAAAKKKAGGNRRRTTKRRKP